MNGDRAKLVKGPVTGTLLKLTFPMIFALVSMVLFNLVDTMYIGMIGPRQLAAMSYTFPVVFFFSAISIGVGTGATSIISRTLGACDSTLVERLTRDSLLLGITQGLIFSAIGLLSVEPVFTMVGVSGDLMPLVRSYMLIWYLGMPLVTVPMVGNSIIRATGDTKTPMFIMLFAVVVNVVLDPILIFGLGPVPEMGLPGAAWATVASRGSTLLLTLYILKYREKILTFGRIRIREMLSSWKQVLHVGIPAAFINVMAPINTGIITALVSGYGNRAVAGFGSASRLEALMLMPTIALSISLVPFIGQNIGSGRLDRVKRAINMGNRLSVIWGLVVYLFLASTSHLTVLVFSRDPAIVRSFSYYLIFGGLQYGLIGVSFNVSSTFNALGKPMPAATINMLRLFIFMIPLSLLGSAYLGLDGIYLGIAAGNVLAGYIAIIWIRKYLGKGSELTEESKSKVVCEPA